MQKLDSFLMAVSCCSGKILYVSDRVEKLLGHAQVRRRLGLRNTVCVCVCICSVSRGRKLGSTRTRVSYLRLDYFVCAFIFIARPTFCQPIAEDSVELKARASWHRQHSIFLFVCVCVCVSSYVWKAF